MAIDNENIESKIILIDTNQYTGNFERELTAFVTGLKSPCGIGNDLSDLAAKTMEHFDWWEENASPQEDGEGSEVFRPCSIWRSPVNNGENVNQAPFNSVAIFVDDFPTGSILEEMTNRISFFLLSPGSIADELPSRSLDLNKLRQIQESPVKLLGLRFLEPEVEERMIPIRQIMGYRERKPSI